MHNISFTGRVDPHRFYERSKILCVTSVHESFSLVTCEAHTHGVVPIVFDSFKAAPLVVSHGVDGILVKAFRLDQFASELSSLMNDSDKLFKLAAASDYSIIKFNPNVIFESWNTLIMGLKKMKK